jgi:hypothetical protein
MRGSKRINSSGEFKKKSCFTIKNTGEIISSRS